MTGCSESHVLYFYIKKADNLDEFPSICKFCNETITGLPLKFEQRSIKPTGAIVNHFDKECAVILAYKSKIDEFNKEWAKHLG
jgi:hypothetical protein